MLFCLTANHRNTDFDVLDRISRVADSLADDLTQTHSFVRGAVVLATCNRFEAYLELDEPLTGGAVVAREAVLDMLEGPAGADAEALRASAVSIAGSDVVHHLFAVSSGLESMVVGEEEISGQVQRALGAARRAGTTSAALERAFQRATHATREMRATADVAAAGRSLARIALDLADTRVTNWATVPVLLVGTGQYAATTIAALRARGAEDIRVYSATGRAEQFAAKYGIRAESDLRDAIGEADIVLTCTARYVVTEEHIPVGRRRLIIDLGLPRNVDPSVASVEGVELLDLELIGRHAALPELGPGAFEIVGTAASVFNAEQAAAPAIVALRGHIQTALDAEIQRVRDRGGDAATEAALRHLAGVISHAPTVRAREFAAEGRLHEFEDALETLFGIEVPRSQGNTLRGLSAG
ncbi:glutamyl-tRNA reductase [Microbacterium sp. SLBN-146]|uniref:glutamyl-tRNA reductase n=1 Tax=Microbacterium sp. SLBN-146 TaxID=2768457 RepID=UPI001154AD15|nr:glutamyl-tRNA reductase [Microbacterium sp. SLBN-146]TQJ31610.1 glutamyl-tRNA reductase [Microbacterium sp. SLBN-146]